MAFPFKDNRLNHASSDHADLTPPIFVAERSAVFAPTPPVMPGEPSRANLIDVADWVGKLPPARKWVVEEWILAASVTLLAAKGAVGKSLLIQQLLFSIAMGIPFLNLQVESPKPALYINCEDSADELHRRQAAIAQALKIDDAPAGRFRIMARLGEENALGHAVRNDEDIAGRRFKRSEFFEQIKAEALRMGAGIIGLDNVAHLYVGNENDRGEVTAFVNAVSALALETGAAVVLVAHPAKGEGSSYSGSTAWENAVRTRLLMDRPTGENGDTRLRTLKREKANYASKDVVIEMIWRNGAFLGLDAPSRCAGTHDRHDTAFLACLDEATAQHRHVSHSPCSPANYAPKIFAKMKQGRNVTTAGLEAAMERLIQAGRIQVNVELPWKVARHRATGLARTP